MIKLKYSIEVTNDIYPKVHALGGERKGQYELVYEAPEEVELFLLENTGEWETGRNLYVSNTPEGRKLLFITLPEDGGNGGGGTVQHGFITTWGSAAYGETVVDYPLPVPIEVEIEDYTVYTFDYEYWYVADNPYSPRELYDIPVEHDGKLVLPGTGLRIDLNDLEVVDYYTGSLGEGKSLWFVTYNGEGDYAYGVLENVSGGPIVG